jgi:hypothetical protein
VQAAGKKGTYNNLITRAEEQRIGIVIDVRDDDEDVIGTSRNISPITMATSTSCTSGTASTITSRSSGTKHSRRSPKQASEAKLEAKRFKDEYDARYKAAFKDAKNLGAAHAAGGEQVQSIVAG